MSITITDNTVQAEDIILKLDSLAAAYSEVLEMAKQQLENFSISESDWSKIYANVANRIDYWDLSCAVRNRLQDGFNSPAGEDAYFARTLVERLEVTLERTIRETLVTSAIQRLIENSLEHLSSQVSLKVAEEVERQLAQHATTAARDAVAQRSYLQALIGNWLKDDIRAMIREEQNGVQN